MQAILETGAVESAAGGMPVMGLHPAAFAVVNTVLIALTLSLSACGRGQPAGGSSRTTTMVDPCALITRDEAEQILDEPVMPAKREDSMLVVTGRRCVYRGVSLPAPDQRAGRVSITVYDTAGIRREKAPFTSASEYFRREMAALKAQGTRLAEVPKLGQRAFWQPGLGFLYVLERGIYLVIDIDRPEQVSAEPGGASGKQAKNYRQAIATRAARQVVLPHLDRFIEPTHHKSPVSDK